MNITDAREKLAALLVPMTDQDPNVITALTDSLDPPCLLLNWNDPAVDRTTGRVNSLCFTSGHMVITCIAGRIVPGEGVATLESLIAYALDRMAQDSQVWQWRAVSGPRVITIAMTTYLGARIEVDVTLD